MYAAFGRIKHGTSSLLIWAEVHQIIIILKVTMCNTDGMGCFVMNFIALMCLEKDGRDCFPSGLCFLQLEIYAFLDVFPIQ